MRRKYLHSPNEIAKGRRDVCQQPPKKKWKYSSPTHARVRFSPFSSSLARPCYFLCTPKIYFITQTILIRAPNRQQQKSEKGEEEMRARILRFVTFCAKTNFSFTARTGWRKKRETLRFSPATAIRTMFTLFNTNTIPSVSRLFSVRISTRSTLRTTSLGQKAFSVYPTRQNIFIPDISQLANRDDVVLCYYGDCAPEREDTTRAHTHGQTRWSAAATVGKGSRMRRWRIQI